MVDESDCIEDLDDGNDDDVRDELGVCPTSMSLAT